VRLAKWVTHPLAMRGYFLGKLPLALFAGVRIVSLDDESCRTTVPFGWRSQNPFRSIYFAAQAMAAEMSTGAIAMVAADRTAHSIALIITDLEATFTKKANARTEFHCDAGADLHEAVNRAIETGEPASVTVESVGTMADGTEVARFRFTWSFKCRSIEGERS
jgi:hypothetical protein